MLTFIGTKKSSFTFSTLEGVEIVFNKELPLVDGVMYVILCKDADGSFEYVRSKIVDKFNGSANLRKLVE